MRTSPNLQGCGKSPTETKRFEFLSGGKYNWNKSGIRGIIGICTIVIVLTVLVGAAARGGHSYTRNS